MAFSILSSCFALQLAPCYDSTCCVPNDKRLLLFTSVKQNFRMSIKRRFKSTVTRGLGGFNGKEARINFDDPTLHISFEVTQILAVKEISNNFFSFASWDV